VFLEQLTKEQCEKIMVDIEIIIRKVIKEFKKKKRQRQEERVINWSFIKKKNLKTEAMHKCAIKSYTKHV